MTKGFTHESQHNESKEWYTPPEVFEALGTEFDLDPCAAPGGRPWIPAKQIISLPWDGLSMDWGNLFVWMNPPYGSDTPVWLDKLFKHNNGIALVFARTDTKWFHDCVTKASAFFFTNGRIAFLRPDGTKGNGPGAGSLFVAAGDKAKDVLRNSKLEGWFVAL